MIHVVFMLLTRLTGKEKRVGNYDLMWCDGPVYADDLTIDSVNTGPSYATNTFLGCHNDRRGQITQMFKQLGLKKGGTSSSPS